MVNDNLILTLLKDVEDPEMGVNIVDLGLIYDVKIENEEITIEMTLTSPACPAGPEIIQAVRDKLYSIQGISDVRVKLVWSPRWIPEMMSDEARDMLGLF